MYFVLATTYLECVLNKQNQNNSKENKKSGIPASPPVAIVSIVRQILFWV